MRRLHIDRLALHLPEDLGGEARELAAWIGREVLGRLHGHLAGRVVTSQTIDAIHVPPLRLPGPLRATRARREIADRVVQSVVARVNRSSTNPQE
jgi:hypothetical protein